LQRLERIDSQNKKSATNRGVKNYNEDLKKDVCLRSRNMRWPNLCMQEKKKKAIFLNSVNFSEMFLGIK
jgi:hypothetical protein